MSKKLFCVDFSSVCLAYGIFINLSAGYLDLVCLKDVDTVERSEMCFPLSHPTFSGICMGLGNLRHHSAVSTQLSCVM